MDFVSLEKRRDLHAALKYLFAVFREIVPELFEMNSCNHREGKGK